MMGKIVKIATVGAHMYSKYSDELIEVVADYQNQGLEVDIKYSTAVDDGFIHYSAMILGREVEK